MNNRPDEPLNNQDEFLDPFEKNDSGNDSELQKLLKNPIKVSSEDSSKLVKNYLITLFSLIAIAALLIKIILNTKSEFVPYSTFFKRPLTIAAITLSGIVIIVAIIYFIFNVKSLKKISIRNCIFVAVFTLISSVVIEFTYVSHIPNAIIFGIVSLFVAAVLIAFSVKTENDNRKISIIFMSSIFVLFMFFIVFRVFLCNVFENGKDFNGKYFVFQYQTLDAAKPDKNTYNLPSLMEYDEEGYKNYHTMILADKIFSSKKEIDEFYENQYKITKENNQGTDYEVYNLKYVWEKIKPALDEYSDDFFKDNVVSIASFSIYENIDSITFDKMFTRESTSVLNYLVSYHVIPTIDREEYENCGTCVLIGSFPRKYYNEYMDEFVRFSENIQK